MNLILKRIRFHIWMFGTKCELALQKIMPSIRGNTPDVHIEERAEWDIENETEDIIDQRFPFSDEKDPHLNPRKTMLFQAASKKSRCQFWNAWFFRRYIQKQFQWGLSHGITTYIVDYSSPFGLLSLEVLHRLKKEGKNFKLFGMRSSYWGRRKSYRLIPETDIELLILVSQCDHSYHHLCISDNIRAVYPNVGIVCTEKGISVSRKYIYESLLKTLIQ